MFEIARLLLSSGANPTSKNAGGWSALHEAVSTGDPELVIEILGSGSKILLSEFSGSFRAFLVAMPDEGPVRKGIAIIIRANKK